MKVSEGVEWTIHCAVLLAMLPPDTTISRTALADHYGLPPTYLGKHLQSLVRARILGARSGPRGGFWLAQPAESVTLLQIVNAVEGDASPFVCTEIRQHGSGALPPDQCRRPCAVSQVMSEAHQAWRFSLSQTTLNDLVELVPAAIQRRNREKFSAV